MRGFFCLFSICLAAIFGACAAPEYSPPSSTTSSGSENARAASSRPGLGTAWGETLTSEVRTDAFRRAASEPWEVVTLRYNSRAGLHSMTDSRIHRAAQNFVMAGGMVRVSVRRPNGTALPIWQSGRDFFVEGRLGERYLIRVENLSTAKMEVVASVDGLDVMDGRAASFAKRGYLLAPGQTVNIPGFRQSNASVAAFLFSSVAESYAERRHGDTRNVGVIGVALFPERGSRPRPLNADDRLRESADPFPGNRFATPPQ